jgi:hypothetical protein
MTTVVVMRRDDPAADIGHDARVALDMRTDWLPPHAKLGRVFIDIPDCGPNTPDGIVARWLDLCLVGWRDWLSLAIC